MSKIEAFFRGATPFAILVLFYETPESANYLYHVSAGIVAALIGTALVRYNFTR